MAFVKRDSDAPGALVQFLRRGLIGVDPVTGVRGLNQDASEVVGVTVAKPKRFPKAAPMTARVRLRRDEQRDAGDEPAED